MAKDSDQDARPHHGQRAGDDTVERHRNEHVRRQSERNGGERGADGHAGDETDQALHVGHEPPRDVAGADDQADQLERFCDRRSDTAPSFVETELLLVQQRSEHHEADEGGGKEGKAPPQPLQRGDLLHRSPTLGERGHHLFSVRDLFAGTHRGALPLAAHRLAQTKREDGEQHSGYHEQQEGHPPPERVGQHSGAERPDERTHSVRCAVGAEHLATTFDGVVVGQQRVVGGIDDGLTQAAAAAGNGEQHHPRRKPGHAAERRPHERTEDGQRHPAGTIGILRNGHLQGQRSDG